MRPRLLLVSGLILVAAGAAGVDRAGACSCAGLDPRDRLADGTPAVMGEVVRLREVEETPGGTVYDYDVRVDRDFNADLGEEVTIRAGSNEASCGFTWEVGERVAAFLYRSGGRWTTNLCSLVDPDELEAARDPYPRARGRGRLALLAGGSFADARLIALDRRGRILGYGLGRGDVTEISVCPGSRQAAELVTVGAGRARVAVRNLRTLRVVRSFEAPADALEVHCADRPGRRLFVAGVGYPRSHPLGRARVARLTRTGPRTVAVLPGDTLALGRGTAYVADRSQVVAVDLGDGRRRRVASFPDAGAIAPSPGGTRLAVSAARHGLRLLELPGARLLGRVAAGTPVWLSGGRLLVRGVGRPRLYDSDLRPLRRLPGFRAGPDAAAGDLVFGVARRRLFALDVRRGRREEVALLPDPDTFALAAVPGSPTVRMPRLAPRVATAVRPDDIVARPAEPAACARRDQPS